MGAKCGTPCTLSYAARRTNRGLTWHCVKEVPRPLRKIMGKKRLVRSLKTRDLKLAQARRYQALVEFEREIEAARRTTAGAGYIDTALELRASLERIEAGDPATIKAFWGHGGGGYSAEDSPQIVARTHAEVSVDTMVDHLRETEGDGTPRRLRTWRMARQPRCSTTSKHGLPRVAAREPSGTGRSYSTERT